MIRLGKTARKQPEEIIKQAIEFFGPDGYKLEIKEQDEGRVYLQGGGGGVEVTAVAGEKGTSVDIVATEWEHQAKEFLGKLK